MPDLVIIEDGENFIVVEVDGGENESAPRGGAFVIATEGSNFLKDGALDGGCVENGLSGVANEGENFF